MRHSPAANRAPAGAHPPTRPAAADDTTAMRPWAQPVPRPKMVAPIVGAWWYARSRRRGRHGTAHPDAPCWERGRGGERMGCRLCSLGAHARRRMSWVPRRRQVVGPAQTTTGRQRGAAW